MVVQRDNGSGWWDMESLDKLGQSGVSANRCDDAHGDKKYSLCPRNRTQEL